MTFGIKSNVERLASRVGMKRLGRHVPEGFAGQVFRRILELRKEKIEQPPLDSWRFPDGNAQGYDSRTAYSVLKYIVREEDAINRSAALLADHESRRILMQLFAYWALGPKHVLPPIDVNSVLSWYRQAADLRISSSELRLSPYSVASYRVEFDGTSIAIECWLGNLVATFFGRQYFFSRGPVDIAPKMGDIVIDAGACFGDTALAFAVAVGSEGTVHSFEPLPRQRSLYSQNRALNPNLAPSLVLHEYGLDAASNKHLRFSDTGAGARAVEVAEGVEVTTISIDDFVQRYRLARVDYIKMDIEGAETRALGGAATTLRRFRPRLAISAYHSLEDLTGLVRTIADIEPTYRFYLAHHSVHAEETVLYATASSRY